MMKLRKIIILFIIFFTLFLFGRCTLAQSVIIIDETNKMRNFLYENEPITLSVDITKMVIRKIKNVDYELHANQNVNVLTLMKRPYTYCIFGRVKTPERSKVAYFSQPLLLYPSFKLFYNTNNENIITSLADKHQNNIPLTKLFQQGSTRKITLIKGLSYGKQLDKQIKQLSNDNIIFRTGKNQYSSIINMLKKNRIDYTFLYPTLNLERKFNNIDFINFINIQGNPQYTINHMMCSKTPLGKKMITTVNVILNKLYLDAKFFETHLYYLHSDDKENFNAHFSKVFINRNFD